MPSKKSKSDDTLTSETSTYSVHLDDGIVSVEATSSEEAIKKAEAGDTMND